MDNEKKLSGVEAILLLIFCALTLLWVWNR